MSKERPIENGVDLLNEQATYRAYEDLIVIALDTGNIPGARLRFKEAEDVLSPFSLQELNEMACNDYGIELR